MFAKSGGNLSGAKVSTCNEIKLSKGTPKLTALLERLFCNKLVGPLGFEPRTKRL
jgi:hypothetical protein